MVLVVQKPPLFREMFLINTNISSFSYVQPRFLKASAVTQYNIRYLTRSIVLHFGRKLTKKELKD